MWRRLFNLAAAVSLVLCLVSLLALVRTLRYTDSWMYQVPLGRSAAGRQTNVYSMTSAYGDISLGRNGYTFAPGARWPDAYMSTRELQHHAVAVPAAPVTARAVFGGFYWNRDRRSFGDGLTVESSVMGVPWSVVALTAAALPTAWSLRRIRERRRARANRCPTCGYDLCATRARCPECGNQVPNAE